MNQLKLSNPTSNNFTITYDINGDGNPQSFTLHAGETESFPKPVVLNMRKHLGHQIAQTLRGKGVYEDAIKKAYALIDVEGEDYGSKY